MPVEVVAPGMKRYLAEFLGTFGLTLAVLISLKSLFPAVPTAITAALTLGLFVYTIGHISGTHLNPAITLAIASLRKISFKDGAIYILAQFLGGGAAFLFVSQFFGGIPPLPVANTLNVGMAELVGTFFFAFGVAAVVYERVSSGFNGLVVGGSLLLGILVAAAGSNGILNPAVAFGVGSLSWMYMFSPILGAIFGMWVFRMLSEI